MERLPNGGSRNVYLFGQVPFDQACAGGNMVGKNLVSQIVINFMSDRYRMLDDEIVGRINHGKAPGLGCELGYSTPIHNCVKVCPNNLAG